MDNIFIQLALILGLASTLGFIIVRAKLPLLVAYLIGGLLIATLSIFDLHSSVLTFLPEIGIAFVLFLVGMELDIREIKHLGAPILTAGIVQVIITAILGSIIAKFLGFGVMESWYLGIGLSFSSTIVIVKLLLDKKDLTSLYGKLAMGITLLEDLLAVIILLGLTVTSSTSYPLLDLVFKAILLFVIAILLNRYLLTNIFKAVSRSSELLFLTALAFLFVYVSFAIMLGFSVVIGAFLAGVSLASSPYHFQIQGKIKPLRDFFVALFFVYLGTQVNFDYIGKVYLLIIAFTIYAIIIKPALFLLLLGIFGFKKHTLFQAAISISQISEFSMIIILYGLKHGSASPAALTAIALTAVISMLISSLMIAHSRYIYKKIGRFIGIFERKNFRHYLEKEFDQTMNINNHVVVIGGHRVGGEVVKYLKEEGISHLVLDFNPHQVEALIKQKINAIYGDMSDPEILDNLNLPAAKMVISTSQDLDDNLALLEELKSQKINIPVIVRAATIEEAKALYKKGSDFVIIPELIAGDLLTDKLRNHLSDDYFKDRARIEIERLSKKTLAWE